MGELQEESGRRATELAFINICASRARIKLIKPSTCTRDEMEMEVYELEGQ